MANRLVPKRIANMLEIELDWRQPTVAGPGEVLAPEACVDGATRVHQVAELSAESCRLRRLACSWPMPRSCWRECRRRLAQTGVEVEILEYAGKMGS